MSYCQQCADHLAEVQRQQTQLVEAKQGWDSCITDLRQAAEICRNVEAERDRLREHVRVLREALNVLSSDCLRWVGTTSFPVLCRPRIAPHKLALDALAQTEPRP